MLSTLLVGMIGLVVLILLIALRQPVAFAMIVVGAGGIVALNGPGILLSQLKTLAYGQFAGYDLSVVPMFILMGGIATRIGLAAELFRAANAWLGWMRGGVAMSAIAACAGFGSVCGSSLATASTMARIAGPELERYKYGGALATGTLAAGGVLGILIPPSVILVIYAVMVEANIVTMFQAAFIPGAIAVVFFLLTIAIYARLRPAAGPKGRPVGGKEFTEATLGMIPVLVIFGLVIGGIYFGFFNPTPAAAAGVFLVMLYGLLRRRLSVAGVVAALLETAKTTGMIYLILLGAELLKIFMSRAGVPQALAGAIAESGMTPMTAILLFLLAMILLGCLMDSLSMILLVVPFFWPVLVDLNGGLYAMAADSPLGLSTDDLKIWFGIIALIVVELGLITPPVGMNVFVISAQFPKVPMIDTFRGVMPFFAAELVRVTLLLAFPVLVLWLPQVLGALR